jgi:hypothetical protein
MPFDPRLVSVTDPAEFVAACFGLRGADSYLELVRALRHRPHSPPLRPMPRARGDIELGIATVRFALVNPSPLSAISPHPHRPPLHPSRPSPVPTPAAPAPEPPAGPPVRGSERDGGRRLLGRYSVVLSEVNGIGVASEGDPSGVVLWLP